ncbi:MAG: hypothetical protein FWF84_00685 [Kiritimatiellaeota bacterium]|nr:hypothetical protein [Kiritimatiellota bacterium]
MKKSLMVATLFAVGAWANAGTYTWGQFVENSLAPSVTNPDEAHVFFLGKRWHDVAYDGSFDAEAGTLTSRTDGTVFAADISGVSHFSDDAGANPCGIAEILLRGDDLAGQFYFYFHDAAGETATYSPLNWQWVAVVLANEATPDRFGIKVFHIAGLSDEAEVDDFGEADEIVDMAEYESWPVPEPASGLLALAGIALLFRRSKR